MRKFFVIFFLCISIISGVSAGEKSTDTLTKLENSVFGISYPDQKQELRLNRLEENVYGIKKKGSPSERLKHLAKDLNSDVIGQEITPCEDTLAQQEYKSDNSVDYPIIDDVEKRLKITSKSGQTLHSRLVAIEKELFKKVYDTDDFYTRVERIKGEVYQNNELAYSDDDEDEIVIPEYSSDDIFDSLGIDRLKRHNPRMNQGSNNDRISRLEKKLLHRTYSDESENDRLARLENTVFDTDFYYDEETERLNRLEGAVKGQSSANKYDNNKIQQRINTALQIGAMILMVLACIL